MTLSMDQCNRPYLTTGRPPKAGPALEMAIFFISFNYRAPRERPGPVRRKSQGIGAGVESARTTRNQRVEPEIWGRERTKSQGTRARAKSGRAAEQRENYTVSNMDRAADFTVVELAQKGAHHPTVSICFS